jgi:hypothetical protein|tara:strand:- start:1020 stop:1373 length:354 start_codon:yes stop_codon:yes gene_type:complete
MKVTKSRLKELIKEELSLLEAEFSPEDLINRLVKVHKEVASGQGSVGDSEAERGLKDLTSSPGEVSRIATSILELMPEVGKPDPSGGLSGFLGQRIGYLHNALKREHARNTRAQRRS